ncbi:MAG: homoserine dehydrogenase, partial [Candidatus Hecatellaceae archaeon]
MRIILLGFGTVGQGFARLVSEACSELIGSYGIRPRIVAVADRGGAAVNLRGLDVEKLLQMKRKAGTVAAYPDHGKPGISGLKLVEEVPGEVVVEVTPTNIRDGEPGLSHIMAALKAGKHVVTANKGPMALA